MRSRSRALPVAASAFAFALCTLAARAELTPPATASGASAPYNLAQSGASRESLFGDDVGLKPKSAGSSVGLRGFVQTQVARTYSDPEHWSRGLVRAELSAQGSINSSVKWKLSGRAEYDAVYDLGHFYPPDVRRDQRYDVMARENYLDIGAGNWDFRLGRQHIVWGEVVGLFFADVVSAKDQREFILTDFDILRIPQWAARAEYTKGDYHAELVWIPVPTYDRIGKPGAEFFPAPPPPPPGFGTIFRSEVRPSREISNTNYGARVSALKSGWDVSAFYYRSMDAQPTFYREVVGLGGPQPAFIFEARHDRINQYGATLGKDFRSFVLKAEAVYTRGRSFNVQRLSDPDGVVRQNTLDWVVGLDFTLPADTRLNLQAFQRVFFNHDPDTVFDKYENGYSVLVNHKLTDRLEGEVLWIASFNRTDWLLHPRLIWNFEKNWRAIAGVDVFHGPPLGFFGRFSNRDRVYAELRYSF